MVLSALMILIGLSVLGRLLNTILHSTIAQIHFKFLADALIDAGIGPIYGDFELVEAGLALAVFAFLPICQMSKGHARVDFIFNHLPCWLKRGLDGVISILFAGVLVIIAWRLHAGMVNKMDYGETSYLLEFPIWWVYGACLVMAVLAAVVACYDVLATLLRQTS